MDDRPSPTEASRWKSPTERPVTSPRGPAHPTSPRSPLRRRTSGVQEESNGNRNDGAKISNGEGPSLPRESEAAAGTPGAHAASPPASPQGRAPGPGRIAVLAVHPTASTKGAAVTLTAPPTSPRRPQGVTPDAASRRASTDTPVAPLTEANLEKFEVWQRAQLKKECGLTSSKSGSGTAGRAAGASPPLAQDDARRQESVNGREDRRGRMYADGSLADLDPDSEDDDVYNARVERGVIDYVKEIRGLTLYLDPCPPLPTADLSPESSPRAAAHSPRTAVASSPTKPSASPTTTTKEGEGMTEKLLRRRNTEKRIERAEVEKKIRYITRDQLRQLYLDNHEELIECIDELVVAEAKVTEMDDDLARMEKRVTMTEEELELTRIQLAAAEECNEDLMSDKAEALRKLMESKGELAMLSARNIKLQQRLDGEDKAGKTSVEAPTADPSASASLAHAEKAREDSERKAEAAEKQVNDLKSELAAVKGELSAARDELREAEEEARKAAAAAAPQEPSDAVTKELESLRAKCERQDGELAAQRRELDALRLLQRRHTPTSTTGAREADGDPTTAASGAATFNGSFRRARSNSASFHTMGGSQVLESQRSPSAVDATTAGGDASGTSLSDAPREVARLRAELQRCERELALAREHARKQSEMEAKLLVDVAHMARQLQTKERLERGVRHQRKADAERPREQLVEELTELRLKVMAHEATIAALTRSHSQQQQPQLPSQRGESVSARSALTLATNTTDIASRASSAADGLSKDYISVAAPGSPSAIGSRRMSQAAPPPQPHSARSGGTGSPAGAGGTPSRLPARPRYTNAAMETSPVAQTHTAAPTPAPEAPSPDRFSTPEVQRRRESIFAQLDAAKRSRDRKLVPEAASATGSARRLSEDAPRGGTPPPAGPPPGSARRGSGAGPAVAPISPPARSQAPRTLVMYTPATNSSSESPTRARSLTPPPLPERDASTTGLPQSGRGVAGRTGSARHRVDSSAAYPPASSSSNASPVPETARSDQSKPYAAFALPGMAPAPTSSPPVSPPPPPVASVGVSDTLRCSSSAAIPAAKTTEEDGATVNHRSPSLSTSAAVAEGTEALAATTRQREAYHKNLSTPHGRPSATGNATTPNTRAPHARSSSPTPASAGTTTKAKPPPVKKAKTPASPTTTTTPAPTLQSGGSSSHGKAPRRSSSSQRKSGGAS